MCIYRDLFDFCIIDICQVSIKTEKLAISIRYYYSQQPLNCLDATLSLEYGSQYVYIIDHDRFRITTITLSDPEFENKCFAVLAKSVSKPVLEKLREQFNGASRMGRAVQEQIPKSV